VKGEEHSRKKSVLRVLEKGKRERKKFFRDSKFASVISSPRYMTTKKGEGRESRTKGGKQKRAV